MKPYYEHAGIQIFCGDCRELFPSLQHAGTFLLSDPPYGMDYKPLRGSDGSKRWSDGVVGDATEFDPRWLIKPPHSPSVRNLCLWGAHHYSHLLPSSPGWIVWDKTPQGRKEAFIASDVDMAWTSFLTRSVKFSMQWGGEARGGEGHFHPTQKPVALADWILRNYFTPGCVIDPYMGAGWVLVAAKNLGFPAIGIEIEEKYCEIAAKRLSQEVLQFA